MQLWLVWWSVIEPLRAVCARQRSFLWLAVATAGICARGDLMGVSSIVRALGLAGRCYDRLLDFFHSPAIDPDRLSRAWTQQALRLFPAYHYAGRPVLLGDGIKIPKSGRKMPAVKLLYQDSEGNTKPRYIMGHCVQVVSMLAAAGGSFFAVPLAGRIHEGVKFTNRDHRTLPVKFAELLDAVAIGAPFYLVADAAFACRSLAGPLVDSGNHLISRLARSAVAFQPVAPCNAPRRRGRPRLYGLKIKLWTLFDSTTEGWQHAPSPVYGEHGVMIRFLCRDLLWRPLRRVVRLVLVAHPTRGRCIFITTDLSMPPIEVIRLYGLRFKIELSFKQALRVVGVYAYHFWMSSMGKLARGSRTQYLHRKSDDYRAAVRRKLAAYHRHIQVGLISQGILQYLAVKHSRQVWASFGSWLRTVRPGIPASELVTAAAMRNTLPEFLADPDSCQMFKKFMHDHIDPALYEPLRLAG